MLWRAELETIAFVDHLAIAGHFPMLWLPKSSPSSTSAPTPMVNSSSHSLNTHSEKGTLYMVLFIQSTWAVSIIIHILPVRKLRHYITLPQNIQSVSTRCGNQPLISYQQPRSALMPASLQSKGLFYSVY